MRSVPDMNFQEYPSNGVQGTPEKIRGSKGKDPSIFDRKQTSLLHL